MAADIVDLGFRVDTSDIEQATKKFSLLDREFGKVEKSSGLVSRSFESIGESGKKSGGLVSRAFSETTGAIDLLRKAALGLSGVLAGISFVSMASDALQRAKEIQRVSDAFGVNAQSIQEWQTVAKKSGIEADKMGDIFKDVSDKIGDFATTGGGEAKDLFEALNLKIKDFKNLAPDKALEKVGQALATSGLTRSQKIFLLEGLADDASLLLPKLENISAELAAVRAQGERTGAIMSQADLATLNEANKNIDALKAAWMGLSNNIGVAAATLLNVFAPYLQAVLESVAGLFNSFAAGLNTVIQYLSQFSGVINPILGYIGDFGLGVAAFAASAVGLSAVSMAFGAITSAVSSLGAVLLANPITATLALIAGSASLIYQNWEPLSAWWSDFWSVFGEPANQAFNDLKASIENSAVGQALKDVWAELPADIQAELEGLAGTVGDTFEHISDVISDKGLVAGGIQLFQELNIKILSQLADLSQGVQDQWNMITQTLEDAGVLDVLADAWDSAVGVVLNLADDLLSGLDQVWADIIDGLATAFDDVGGILDEVGQTFSVWAEYIGEVLAEIAPYVLPALAALADYFAQTWDLIAGTIADAWNLITTIISTSWEFAVGMITTGLQVLRGDWDGAWQTMQNTFGSFYEGIANTITSLLNLFTNFAQRVGNILSGVWNGLKSLVGAAETAQGMANTMQEASVGKMADDVAQVGVAAKQTDSALKSTTTTIISSVKAAYDYAESQRRVRNVQEDTRKHVEGLGTAHRAAIAPVSGLGGALGKSGDAAKKAAGGHKGLSDAQKEAKKAAEDLARAQDKIADLFTKEAQKHDILTLKLNQGADAARALELQYQTMHEGVKILSDAKAAELVQMENANKALETEIKKREDAAKAIEKAGEAVKKSESAMQIAKDAIYANDEALRVLTLSHEDGYSKAAATAQAHNEALTESYKNQRDIVQDLAKFTSELAGLDAQMAALKAGGVAAMEAEESRQNALNDLKEKGIGIESALGQQYLAAKAAIEAKTKALEVEQRIQENLTAASWLDKELIATQQGSAALAALNVQKQIAAALDKEGLSLESEQGRRLAESIKLLAAKNQQLELAQFLAEAANDNKWLQKEIDATQQGEKALKAINLEKRIHEELTRQNIAAGTAEANQVAATLTQQDALKEKLASIQELRQPISQFFNDVFSGGKNAFKNLGDWIGNWLKKIAVEFATNKIMLSLGLDAGGLNLASGASGVGGLFSSISNLASKGLAGLGTALSGGLSGIMGSIGSFVSAIPGWGWALAGVAAIASKFIGPSDPKARFTQGANSGQAMLGQGGYGNNPHNYQTAFGQIGFTAASDHIGRQKGFVEAAHKMMQAMVQLDAMIAKTLPNSIGKISEALKGLETSGFSTADMMKQRYLTIAQSLSTDLQAALAGGKDLTAMTAEEIVGRFQYLAQVAESGLIPALEQLGLAGTQTKESMIAFAMGLADVMGGIDAAKAALDNYYNTAYTDAERLAMTQSAAKTKLDEYNASLGLSGSQYIDTIAKLRARIEAEDASTAAGQKNIATLLGMTDAIKALSGTAEEAAAKLKGQWDDFNSAAYTDAQKQQLAQKQAKSAIDAFNQSLGLTGNKTIDNIIELRAYMRTLDGNTEAGREAQQAALGMTSAFVAFGGTAEQIKQKIAGLREGIKGLVSNLYGSSSTSLSTSGPSVDSNQAALSAAQATLDSLRNQQSAEQERISSLNEASQDAYEQQLDNYRALTDAAKNLLGLSNGFADNARDAAENLKAAQLDYNATLRAAQAGDVDAANKLGDTATRLREALGAAYNNDSRASSAIAQIENQLRSTAGILTGLAGSEPTKPADIASTVLVSLEQQIKAQEAIVNNLQSITSSTSSAANEAKAAADRTAMAKELATKIGELGLATDRSAWEILAKNGINISDLAKDFGINLTKLDATFVRNTADLATRLNVNTLDLMSKLNVNFADLAKSFNIDVSNLNNGTLGKLDKLADQLKVSSVDLAGKLGINIDKLGDLMANKLASLPNIPADIRAGLAPHLQDIRNAADPATLQKELRDLQAYVNTLPPGIKDQLNGQLQGILGYTGDTKTNTADTKTETMALRNVSGRVTELTTYTRDELTGQYITKMLQNSRALNQNAANIGKSAVPSFAIGSDKLPGDMLANVHKDEMIFTARQSDSLRDLAIYNQAVIPQIASYLSELAANEEQAPVFLQPVYVAPVSQRSNESGRDELLDEVKGLRKDNAELRKSVESLMPYQSAIANNTRKIAVLNDKWDTDGQPEERVA